MSDLYLIFDLEVNDWCSTINKNIVEQYIKCFDNLERGYIYEI